MKPGVKICGNRFHAYIRLNGKQTYLGRYKTEDEAANAYAVAKAKKYITFTPLTIRGSAAIISLTRGLHAKVDIADWPSLSKYKWCANSDGYACRFAKRGKIYLHHCVLPVSEGMQADHIDRDPLNNRRSNLREVTRLQNMANTGMLKNNKTGFKGVHLSGNSYIAQISMNGKRTYLGSFDSAENAAKAYDTAARESRGEIAFQNITGK